MRSAVQHSPLPVAPSLRSFDDATEAAGERSTEGEAAGDSRRKGTEETTQDTAGEDGEAAAARRRAVAMTPQRQQPPEQQAFGHTPPLLGSQPQPAASMPSTYYPTRPQQQQLAQFNSATDSAVSTSASLFQSLLSLPSSFDASKALSLPQPLSHSLLSPQAATFHQQSALPPIVSLLSTSPFVLQGAPLLPFAAALSLAPLSSTVPTSVPLLSSQQTTNIALLHASLSRSSAVDSSANHMPGTASFSPSAYSAHAFPYPPTQPALPSPLSHSSALAFRPIRASVWHCPMGCGQTYKKSSGRSIRRHFVFCFRQHNESAASSMSDTQLSSLIGERQDTGQLQTGLRRWRMRSSRRQVDELRDEERWECVWGCGKRYRSTSTRSIQRHIAECARRAGGGGGGERKQVTRKGTAGRESDEEEEDEDEEAEVEEAETTAKPTNGHQYHSQHEQAAQQSQGAASTASVPRSPPSKHASASIHHTAASLPSLVSIAARAAADGSATRKPAPTTLQLLSSIAQLSDAQHAGNNAALDASSSSSSPR